MMGLKFIAKDRVGIISTMGVLHSFFKREVYFIRKKPSALSSEKHVKQGFKSRSENLISKQIKIQKGILIYIYLLASL
jgi:hypothetical protein